MRKVILLLAAILISPVLFAQVPDGISHQAVMRDAEGTLITNQPIGIRVSVLQGSPEGTAVYTETHTPESNDNGLITYVIGQGAQAEGSFAGIDWSDGPYFLKTEVDPDGGSDYSMSGATQLLSVPYAMYAESSANDFDGDMQGERIINMSDPHEPQDAATKAYIDHLVDSLATRIAVLEDSLGIEPPDEPGTLTDIDGNQYQTIEIGDLEWMAENLRVTRYNNGDDLNAGLSNIDWENATEGAYAVHEHDNVIGIDSEEEMIEAYGKLYNWYAVSDDRDICPEGWHVPGDDEWTGMVDYLIATHGWSNDLNDVDGIGNKLKSCRQVNSPEGDACDTNEHPRWEPHEAHYGTDELGFAGLPSGNRHFSGPYTALGEYGGFWSSTENTSNTSWSHFLSFTFGNLLRGSFEKPTGFSIRCVREVNRDTDL